MQDNPPKWAALEHRSLGMGGVAELEIHALPPPTCYHAKFGSCATKDVSKNRKERYWERWYPAILGWGIVDHLQTSPLPYVLPREIW